MFGFKPMITGSPVTISSDGTEPTRFDSMTKASKNSKSRVHSNGKEYVIKFITS